MSAPPVVVNESLAEVRYYWRCFDAAQEILYRKVGRRLTIRDRHIGGALLIADALLMAPLVDCSGNVSVKPRSFSKARDAETRRLLKATEATGLRAAVYTQGRASKKQFQLCETVGTGLRIQAWVTQWSNPDALLGAAEAQKPPFEAVLVDDFARLGRGWPEITNVLRGLAKCGVGVIECGPRPDRALTTEHQA